MRTIEFGWFFQFDQKNVIHVGFQIEFMRNHFGNFDCLNRICTKVSITIWIGGHIVITQNHGITGIHDKWNWSKYPFEMKYTDRSNLHTYSTYSTCLIQCAALTTYWSEIKLPPQKLLVSLLSVVEIRVIKWWYCMNIR